MNLWKWISITVVALVDGIALALILTDQWLGLVLAVVGIIITWYWFQLWVWGIVDDVDEDTDDKH